MFSLLVALTLLGQLHSSAAKSNCPLYGPLLPKPTNLLQDAGIRAAGRNLDSVFPRYIDNNKVVGADRFSYAVEVFSANDAKPLWSHYWTAPNLRDLNSTGVSKVDTNTVFRVGSITKIYTVLTFLATVGDGIWNDPVTKYIPELATIARAVPGGSMFVPDWDSITVGSLASQTSGLIRDYALLGELGWQLNLTRLYDMGFPPINITEFPPCGTNPTCSRQQLLYGLSKLPPSFPSHTTPTYSDLGFVILSYIAETITGKDFKSLVKDTVIAPLKLKNTFVTAPDDSLGIIPGNRYSTSWAFEMAEESATGNMYASAGDLSAIGRAIMKSTLLKPAVTRRWLKPSAFTSDPKSQLGMPWGVRQIELSSDQTYQFVHAFNKIGSLGSYTSLIAVIPELDLGFSVLAAGDLPAGLATDIADTLTTTYVPAIMATARTQANVLYAGTYRVARVRGSPSINSTLTITTDASKPGLGVTNWISNGTDMGLVATAIGQNITQAYLDKVKPSVRLYPTGLEEKVEGGGKRIAFKAVFEDLSLADKKASMSTDCSTWVTVTAVVYGSQPLDLFIFDVDEDGDVTGVENAALRVKLGRV
ncbi:beta-lactamase/transpeptidase-like protein [Bombardia bombarda]|uniref:Beta-lactamase/transpeptidase-like protein n=1 Tax=Bombardia bombarda TaxID=252184 RepID=A0AA39XMS9_9PEZI|nr:beta-lactamase/transpeptidase-like protein [Bombardia bombarda]